MKPGAKGAPSSESPEELRGTLRDVFALLALPALTQGRSRQGVLESLLDSLAAVIPSAFSYARTMPADESVEAVRPASLPADRLAAIRSALDSVPRGLDPVAFAEEGKAVLRLVAAPIGFYADAGVLAIATTREDFPTPREQMLLRAATSLAASALESARLLESVVQSDRRKDEFLALLGHELRNPLAPVLTAVQLMKVKGIAADGSRDVIERQILHMVRLVDDLLDASRISRGKMELRRGPTDLARTIAHAVELASPAIQRGQHQLSVQVPEGLVLDGDPQRLAQVFSNLLTNAARYTEKPGEISVRCTVEDSEVTISVRDTGRGIRPEMIARIFDPFIQAERSKDALAGGLGLGLAIVKTIVALHGGAATAHSDGPGKGSEFRVTLPLREGIATDGGTPGKSATARPRARKVLIVDDNEDARILLANALQARGHVACAVGDAEEGLRLAAKSTPDVALLDLGLPGMDGYELCAKLRNDLGGKVRIVAVTGYGESSARAAARRAGFDAHLVKPVDLEELFARIES